MSNNNDIKFMVEGIKYMKRKKIIYEQEISNFKILGRETEYYKTHTGALLDLIKPAKITFSDIQQRDNNLTWDMEYETGIKIHYESNERKVLLSADSVSIQPEHIDDIKRITVYLKNTFSSDNNY